MSQRVAVSRSIVVAAMLLLTACGGGGGGGSSDQDGGNPAPINAAPTANAGPDQSINEGAIVQLMGSATDSDGTIVSFAWIQTAGTTVALSNAAAAAPTFVAPGVDTVQNLVFRLTVADNAGSTASDTVQIAVQPVVAALVVTSLELAQTHVLPPSGRSWTLTDATGAESANESLHLTGDRTALVLVGLSASDAASPMLEGMVGGVSLGEVSLNPPASLPPTESGGEAYATNRYSATVPSAWIKPGVQFRVSANNYTPSTLTAAAVVGGDFPMILRVLPFYVFGADETNTSRPLSLTGAPDTATKAEIFAKWPVASLTATNHPAAKAQWPCLVLPPGTRAGVAEPARRATSIADYRDTFTGMGAVLGVLGALLDANGESVQPVQYYAPLLAIGPSGAYSGPGGGLGGGNVGTGDEVYRGIFIHEQGHAYGLPHAGEAFDTNRYPYEWGSLKGSLWGYDSNRSLFLAPFLPTSASTYSGCASDVFAGHARAADAKGRCVKQDPMQSGSGDQAAGDRFTAFSDYSTAVMQRYFEGRTTVNGDGSHAYSGGKIVRDASFPGGWKRWDTVDQRWINVTPTTTQGGIFGLDGGLPIAIGVPVYAITLTISNAGTPGTTQIYPPLRFTGNLRRTFDPTQAADRTAITPDTSPTYFWYCRNGGCDYTLRITYANLSRRHVLLQGGFRPFNQASGTPPASASDPLDGNSFRRFAVNVPDEGNILSVELLSTPRAWEGFPVVPSVLASR
ncbi:MAG: M66 family metalloprotease [Panacagrimonas sp.]